MKTRTTIHWLAGLAGALLLAVPVLGWAASPTSHDGWGVGGIPVALEECQLDLDQCQLSNVAFPGDGWPEDDLVVPGGTPLSYTDNQDGTFTDDNTGLMWELKLAVDDPLCDFLAQVDRDVHCVQNRYTWTAETESPYLPNGTAFTEFLAELKAGQFAGYDDWRLPTVKELQSLVDYSVPSPGPLVKQDPDGLPGATAGAYYWSSTASAGGDDFAYSVGFVYGSVVGLEKGEGFGYRVRAVRGGW